MNILLQVKLIRKKLRQPWEQAGGMNERINNLHLWPLKKKKGKSKSKLQDNRTYF